MVIGSFARKAWVAALVILTAGVPAAVPSTVGAQQEPTPAVDIALDDPVAAPDAADLSEAVIEADPASYIELDTADVLNAVVASSGSAPSESSCKALTARMSS